MGQRRQMLIWVGLGVLGLLVSGCGAASKGDWVNPYSAEADAQRESVFGEGGIQLFGDKKRVQDEGGGIAVNSFLWRASLDTLSFMPLSSADPFGGVIITDWHALAETPNERFKANIFILGRSLRADGLRVALFRQVQTDAGWQDTGVPEKAATDLENQILTRARQMRQAALQAGSQ